MKRRIAYRLFTIGGRLLPDDERERLLRVLRTGDPEERVPVHEVVLMNSTQYIRLDEREIMSDVRSNVFREVNKANGWYDADRTVGDGMALLHSEVSEAFDVWRANGFDDQTDFDSEIRDGFDRLVTTKLAKPEGYGSEMADILIRLLDQCDRDGVDLVAEFERKLAYNRTRGYRHGGRKV